MINSIMLENLEYKYSVEFEHIAHVHNAGNFIIDTNACNFNIYSKMETAMKPKPRFLAPNMIVS